LAQSEQFIVTSERTAWTPSREDTVRYTYATLNTFLPNAIHFFVLALCVLQFNALQNLFQQTLVF